MTFVEVTVDLTEWGVPLGYRAIVVDVDDEQLGLTSTYGNVVIQNAVGSYVLLEKEQFRYLTEEDFDKAYSTSTQFIIGIIIGLAVYIGDKFTT